MLTKILCYLQDYIRESFDWKTYGYVAAFLTLIISINYIFGVEHYIADNHFGTPAANLMFGLIYVMAYYGVAIPILLLAGHGEKLRQPEFWWKSFLLIAIMTARRASDTYIDWSETLTHNEVDLSYLSEVLLYINRLHTCPTWKK